MTFWDFASKYLDKLHSKGGIAWALLFIAFCGFIYILIHPEIVKEWNVQITMWMAAIIPRKRKRAFEKKLNLTIDSAKKKFSESAPPYLKKFLPYDLKVEWVSENDTLETVTDKKQIIVYVPSYKNELSQAVGVLHSYCSKGFASSAKVYMPEEASQASDLIVTQKLTQYAGHNVYDYFNREYLPELLKSDTIVKKVFQKLQKVDTDGLFIPVLLNEIDKYSSRIYPAIPTPDIAKTIVHLMDFIYTIVVRSPGEIVPLTFCEDEIKIKIVLAVSDISYNIEPCVKEAEDAIQEQRVNTIYVLATGSKIPFAERIAESIYERNPLDVFEPLKTEYKRYTKHTSGSDSICFEINKR